MLSSVDEHMKHVTSDIAGAASDTVGWRLEPFSERAKTGGEINASTDLGDGAKSMNNPMNLFSISKNFNLKLYYSSNALPPGQNATGRSGMRVSVI